MFPDDFPLLSAPSLMTVLLHAAADGPVTPEIGAERVADLLAMAEEKAGLPPAALLQRLRDHLRTLESAGLLEPIPGGALRLTLRGREALRRNPDGIDASDLMAYPDFAARMQGSARNTPLSDPREASFEQGYVARGQGRPFTANPHRPNSADHLSWENGWMQALDDDRRAAPRK